MQSYAKEKKTESVTQKLKLSKIEKDALKKLVTDLRFAWHDTEFKLFGSKVKGIADEESDLDVLIILPCDVTPEIRRQIIYTVFDINLEFETNISALIVSKIEWENKPFSLLPIHAFIEEEGIPL